MQARATTGINFLHLPITEILDHDLTNNTLVLDVTGCGNHWLAAVKIKS